MKWFVLNTVKSVLSGHLKIDKTKVVVENDSLMDVESIAECSPWSILQYFRPALRIIGIENQFYVFFLSGHLSQVLPQKMQLIHMLFFLMHFVYVLTSLPFE